MASNVIKLTESDILDIVKKVINEQQSPMQRYVELYGQEYVDMISTQRKRVIEYYKNLYGKPEMVGKFKDKSVPDKVINYVQNFKIKLWPAKGENSKKFGWVQKGVPYVININTGTIKDGKKAYETILHEGGHLIDFFMQKLGVDTMAVNPSTGYQASDGQDNYVASPNETFTRVQRLRSVFGISPTANSSELFNKLAEAIKSKRITFDGLSVTRTKDNRYLVLSENVGTKGMLSNLWGIFSKRMKIDGRTHDDIAALFAEYSVIKNNKIYIDVMSLGKLNYGTKGAVTEPEGDSSEF